MADLHRLPPLNPIRVAKLGDEFWLVFRTGQIRLARMHEDGMPRLMDLESDKGSVPRDDEILGFWPLPIVDEESAHG